MFIGNVLLLINIPLAVFFTRVQTRFILHRFAIYFAQRLAQRKLLRRIEKSTELTVASKTGVG